MSGRCASDGGGPAVGAAAGTFEDCIPAGARAAGGGAVLDGIGRSAGAAFNSWGETQRMSGSALAARRPVR
jgi:hypothetical protein